MIIEYDTLIRLARGEAKRYHHKYIRTEHLLLALMDIVVPDDPAWQNLDIYYVRQGVAMMRCPTCDTEEQMELSVSAQRAYKLAQSYAAGHPVEARQLLRGLLQSSLTVQRLLRSCDVNLDQLLQSLESEMSDGS